MTTKRDFISLLKIIKKEPRLLTSDECDELILLLGGTTRPNHRPENRVLRRGNWTSIAEVVFSYLENAEQLKEHEADLREVNRAGYLQRKLIAQQPEVEMNIKRHQADYTSQIEHELKSLNKRSKRYRERTAELSKLTSPDYLVTKLNDWKRNLKKSHLESTEKQKLDLERRIESLRPRSVKKRVDAEKMASEWFAKRNIKLTAKQIQNRLRDIQIAAGLKSLGLSEWREIKAADQNRPSKIAARKAEEAQREKNSQALFDEMIKARLLILPL